MKTENRTVTFRISKELYQKCLDMALDRSKEENKMINISDIIRDAIEKLK